MGKFAKLILAIVISIGLSIPAFAAINPEDVIGLWTFDEGDGDIAKDSSENGRDGEIVGNAEWVDGKYGQAIEFTGGFVRVEHDDNMDLETFSMTAWVNVPGALATYQYVVGKEAWPNRNYAMWILPDRINVGITDTNGNDKQKQGGVVADGNWHHIAGTYDMESLKVYVDGVMTGQIALDTTPNVCLAPLMIASQPPNGGGPTAGIIDDVGVFNVGLEEDDVLRIMEDGVDFLVSPVEPGDKLYTVWGAMKALY